MDGYIMKGMAFDKQVRILFADNTELIGKLCDGTPMSKLLKEALGKTVSVTSMLPGILKDRQRISLKVRMSCDKLVIFAEADANGHIRGYIGDKWQHSVPARMNAGTLEQLIGSRGSIRVSKDIGMNGIFTGITGMPYGNITDDFSHYFNQSEQSPTYMAAEIAFDEREEIAFSNGLMAQLLPGAPSWLLSRIRRTVSAYRAQLKDPATRTTFPELPSMMFPDIEIIERLPIRIYCGCSKEMMYPMLYVLDKCELANAAASGSGLEIVCHACGNKYHFEPDEIVDLM